MVSVLHTRCRVTFTDYPPFHKASTGDQSLVSKKGLSEIQGFKGYEEKEVEMGSQGWRRREGRKEEHCGDSHRTECS